MPFVRIEGWESRLLAVIEAARRTPYALGEHDCFRLACRAVWALAGVDLWAPWQGAYRTRREALQLIADYAGAAGTALQDRSPTGLFRAAFSRLFETDPIVALMARRGDIVEYEDREPHLGVCLGARVAVLAESGLLFVPLAACRRCWRIG